MTPTTARQRRITHDQVSHKITDAQRRVEAALNRAKRNGEDREYQLGLAEKALSDWKTWAKTLDSLL